MGWAAFVPPCSRVKDGRGPPEGLGLDAVAWHQQSKDACWIKALSRRALMTY